MRTRLTVGILTFIIVGIATAWQLKRRGPIGPVAILKTNATQSPTPTPISTSSPTATPYSTPVETYSPEQSQATNYAGAISLIIPVQGVRPGQLIDTFSDARSDGRTHDAIDIPAAGGTQVLAAADGEIIKLFQSDLGGTTIYQLSVDKKLIFYYAHLQRYADGLIEGQNVHQGEVIAYVGDTGNAGPGNYHLHFSIAIVSDPRRYWEGSNINPYPLLHR